MIVWKEQDPDLARQPIEDLLRALSFTDACAVMLATNIEIVVQSRVLGEILEHLSLSRLEQGGLLVGRVFERRSVDPAGGWLVAIEASVRAPVAAGTSVSLEMGAEVWEAARTGAAQYGSVVGWYHSHPDLGAFFSGTDRRTQKSFFREQHCVGLVVDPVRKEECWFVGPDSRELARSSIRVLT